MTIYKDFGRNNFDENANEITTEYVQEKAYIHAPPAYVAMLVFAHFLLWVLGVGLTVVGLACTIAVDAWFAMAIPTAIFIVIMGLFVLNCADKYLENWCYDHNVWDIQYQIYFEHNKAVDLQAEIWREKHPLEEKCRLALTKNPNYVADLIRYIKDNKKV